ncbi:MAG TPA: hypothetical protein VMP01_02725 [Pirellulaceae bacterium]|nr:hypothetical protein [Pirellulaceae bacterium]
MTDGSGVESLAANRPQRLHSTPGRRTVLVVAFCVIILITGMRGVSEFAMMGVHGPDPQMPIWSMFMVVKLALWLGVGLAFWLLVVVWRSRVGLLTGAVLLLGWGAAICGAIWQYSSAAKALADASNPSTSPARLSELAQFDGIQAGYELDNRIASNLNTPPDALRTLHERNQLGTQLKLASNPNTPVDILRRLVHHEDEWVRRSLADNPKLPESVRREIETHKK